MDPSDQGVLAQFAQGLQVLIASVFLVAVITKIRDPKGFAAVVSDYRIGPASWVRPVAVAVMLCEAFVAASLLTGLLTEAGLMLAAFALSIFAVAVTVNLLRGRRISCGCFGDSQAVSMLSLVRIALLLSGALVLVALRMNDVEFLSATWALGNGIAGAFYVLQAALLAGTMTMIALWVLHSHEIISVVRSRRLGSAMANPRPVTEQEAR